MIIKLCSIVCSPHVIKSTCLHCPQCWSLRWSFYPITCQLACVARFNDNLPEPRFSSCRAKLLQWWIKSQPVDSQFLHDYKLWLVLTINGELLYDLAVTWYLCGLKNNNVRQTKKCDLNHTVCNNTATVEYVHKWASLSAYTDQRWVFICYDPISDRGLQGQGLDSCIPKWEKNNALIIISLYFCLIPVYH